MNACCALGISLLLAAPALAQTQPANRRPRPPLLVSRLSTTGDYAIYGHGNSSCGTWSATQAGTPSRDLLLAWVQGFLTGTGGFNDDQRKTTTEGIQASITTYCQAHPLDTIEVAAATLFVSVYGEQSASADESPALFITPTDDNLEAFLAAAMINKEVPVTVVNKAERAGFVVGGVGRRGAAVRRGPGCTLFGWPLWRHEGPWRDQCAAREGRDGGVVLYRQGSRREEPTGVGGSHRQAIEGRLLSPVIHFRPAAQVCRECGPAGLWSNQGYAWSYLAWNRSCRIVHVRRSPVAEPTDGRGPANA